MEPKIISFFKELASTYAELNPSLSMCYHMEDKEMYLGNCFGEGGGVIMRTKEFEKLPEDKTERHSQFKELIIDWETKKVKCFFVDGMYFIPGKMDDAVIFGKDILVVVKDAWMIKGVGYEITKL